MTGAGAMHPGRGPAVPAPQLPGPPHPGAGPGPGPRILGDPASAGDDPLAARTLVLVCHGPSCTERGSPETLVRLREGLAASPARRHVQVCTTTCLDNCATGPNVLVSREGAINTGVQADRCGDLVDALAARIVRPGGD